jgi:hypothetical protein
MRTIASLPFAQPAAIAHQSALGDGTETCQLLYEIILRDVEEQIADVDCWFRNRRTLAGWSHRAGVFRVLVAKPSSVLHCFLDGFGSIRGSVDDGVYNALHFWGGRLGFGRGISWDVRSIV